MSNIPASGISGTSTADALAALLQSTVTAKVAPTTGAGTSSTTGTATPPASLPPQTVSDVRASLASLGLNMTQAQVDVLIVQVTISLRDIEADTQNKKIANDQASVKGRLGDQAKQIAEMEAKMEEARKAKESASIADKIKLAFEWIGAVIAIVVAVVAIATSPLTGGALAVVGALLIAAAVCSLISAVDSTVTAATGHGVGYHSAKSMGKSDEEALKHEQAFSIAIAVIGAVCGIAAGGIGAVSAARSAASAGAKVGTEVAGQVAKQTTGAMIKSAFKELITGSFKEGTKESVKWAARGADMAEAVNSIGTQAVGITATAYRGEAQQLNADAKRSEAESKETEALLNMLNDAIDQAFTRLLAAGDRFNAILDGIMEARNDRAQFTARAQFAG
jgi:hypothetical protein